MLQLTSTQITRLQTTLQALCTGNLCALDESINSANKMLEKLGLPATEDMRREYRRVLFATPGFKDLYKGVILTVELLDQTVADGSNVTFPQFLEENNQITVVKIDKGMKEIPGLEGGKVVQGAETMLEDLQTYWGKSGGRIAAAKARQEIMTGAPEAFIDRGMEELAKMALACQQFEHSMLLLLEPEVMRTGDHSIEEHAATSRSALQLLDKHLSALGVHKDLVAIKTNAITAGADAAEQVPPEEAAEATMEVWTKNIDPDVKLVLMLSGGLDDLSSTAIFNAIVQKARSLQAPFTVTSSFGRAAHRKPVEIWSRNPAANIKEAQKAFFLNAEQNELARKGQYDAAKDPRNT